MTDDTTCGGGNRRVTLHREKNEREEAIGDKER